MQIADLGREILAPILADNLLFAANDPRFPRKSVMRDGTHVID